MNEILNLGDIENVAAHRDALVVDLPNILTVAGAEDQIAQLARGEHDEVVNWFRGKVSVGGHGVSGGSFGLTTEQTRDFNPLAQTHGLMGPLRLWRPGDDLPEGAHVGDIVEYRVTPDYPTLPHEIFEAKNTIVVDAKVDGTIGRVDTALGVAVRSEAVRKGGAGEVTVLSGMRAVKADEGRTGLYKQFLPEGISPDTPVEQAFPSATDATLAILQSRCSRFDLVGEIEDPQAGNKPEDRLHPDLGGRTWIARYYDATHAETGAPLKITVVNGEPIAPTGREMNRSTTEPAPRAADTLKDYVALPRTERGQDANIAISYAHLGRIAASLKRSLDTADEGALSRITLVGNMPQQATWDKMNGALHNGGTLGLKEVYPYIKSLNGLLGRGPTDLGV